MFCGCATFSYPHVCIIQETHLIVFVGFISCMFSNDGIIGISIHEYELAALHLKKKRWISVQKLT